MKFEWREIDPVHVCLTFNDLKLFFEFPNEERVIVSGTDHVHVGHTFNDLKLFFEFPNDERVIVSGTDHVHVHVGHTFNNLKLFFEFPNDDSVIVSGTDHVHVGHTFNDLKLFFEFPNDESYCLRYRPRSRSRLPHFQQSKAVFWVSEWRESYCLRYRPRSRSRWPHFQRSKAVFWISEWWESYCLRYRPRSRSRWPYFQRSKAVHSEFLNEAIASAPVHVGHTFNRVEFSDLRISGRISAKFQPKLPSACCYSACLLCHRYIILYIIEKPLKKSTHHEVGRKGISWWFFITQPSLQWAFIEVRVSLDKTIHWL